MDNESEDIGLDFDAIIPTPEIFVDYFNEYDTNPHAVSPLVDSLDWYAWRSKHWGTKWNSSTFEELYSDDTEYQCIFDTPGACPEPILRAIAQRYPSFEGSTETTYGSSGTMREGSIWNGKFVLDEYEHDIEYDFDDKQETDNEGIAGHW